MSNTGRFITGGWCFLHFFVYRLVRVDLSPAQILFFDLSVLRFVFGIAFLFGAIRWLVIGSL